MYKTAEERAFDKKLKQDQELLSRKTLAVQVRIQDGCRLLSKDDFDLLDFQGKMNFHRAGGVIE